MFRTVLFRHCLENSMDLEEMSNEFDSSMIMYEIRMLFEEIGVLNGRCPVRLELNEPKFTTNKKNRF